MIYKQQMYLPGPEIETPSICDTSNKPAFLEQAREILIVTYCSLESSTDTSMNLGATMQMLLDNPILVLKRHIPAPKSIGSAIKNFLILMHLEAFSAKH